MLRSRFLLRGVLLAVLFSAARAPALAEESAATHTFSIGPEDFLLDGNRLQIRCGEIHAARVPRQYWRHRLQSARAMGLNTVCAYLFWNLHEPRPGRFAWTGQADAAEFCRIAQQEGLWVILRPGPYSCAEWEMGGLPWWLLKDRGIQLRTRDPRYLDAARRYLAEVGRVLGPLQVTRGGPILMVQVENEYGFFGQDPQYMGELRQALLEAGFDVPLFACNPKQHLRDGYREDLFPVVNFGSDPEGAFQALRGILPRGPLMCGEFYPGWFDTWGSPHHRGDLTRYLEDLETMLRAGASFSIYMAHGGTSFGSWSGADRPFKPDTSSYDYDAPISEAGWATDKFFRTRELFSRYLLPGESIPDPPARNPVIAFGPQAAAQTASIWNSLPEPISRAAPVPMETIDQGFGCLLYRTQMPPGPGGTLSAAAAHDVGLVFLEGQRVGFLDRRSRRFQLSLPERSAPATLDILVEAMGRVNFGVEVHDRKGLHAPVTFAVSGQPAAELRDWQLFPLPLDAAMLAGLVYSAAPAEAPAFWRAAVELERPGDCFLDMRPWGKGMVWVNGRNLGRYWNIGPQQTMYVPGPWLQAGRNEFVILDLIGPERPEVAALEAPILDQLRPEQDILAQRREAKALEPAGEPLLERSFAAGTDAQEVRFERPARGRYFALESRTAHDGKAYAAIAELALLDAEGRALSAEGWTVAYVDSEEIAAEDGSAGNAIDGQSATFWHTQWSNASPGHPHWLILDLGQPQAIGGFRYVPRPGSPGVGGRIRDYRVYVSEALRVRGG